MLTWNDASDSDRLVDEEHHKLYRMMNRLEPAILAADKPEALERAIGMLYQRMAQHFDYEEELAFGITPDEFAVLHKAHKAILDLLARLRALPVGDMDARRRMFGEFQAALARHDNEIDMPLFSKAMH